MDAWGCWLWYAVSRLTASPSACLRTARIWAWRSRRWRRWGCTRACGTGLTGRHKVDAWRSTGRQPRSCAHSRISRTWTVACATTATRRPALAGSGGTLPSTRAWAFFSSRAWRTWRRITWRTTTAPTTPDTPRPRPSAAATKLSQAKPSRGI